MRCRHERLAPDPRTATVLSRSMSELEPRPGARNSAVTMQLNPCGLEFWAAASAVRRDFSRTYPTTQRCPPPGPAKRFALFWGTTFRGAVPQLRASILWLFFKDTGPA